MRMNISDVKGRIDFGILTIREDEFEAVLDRLPALGTVKARRRYRIRRLLLAKDETYTIAVLRCVEQGNTEALNTARDLLEDLDPRFLLVVGIAGGVPSNEFTLGDVIVSTRIVDFSVEAVLNDHEREYALGGGPLHPDAASIAGDIRAMEQDGEIVGWNTRDAIGMDRPQVEITDVNLYGDDDWQKGTRAKLERHFAENPARPPLVVTGAIASSDRLIKGAEKLQVWLKIARQIQAVEMESAGIYKAAHGRAPFLAIRGISDIVGFKRHPDWTKYACHSAASFMHSFLLTRPVQPCAAVSRTRTSGPFLGARQVLSSPVASMDTRALLEASIGRDAHLASEAAIEIKKRGPDEAKRIFDRDWDKTPQSATTENFLRDVFHDFGENFAHHLVDILDEGARNAVDVAIYAFPRASMSPKSPGDRLYSWANRKLNRRLGGWHAVALPMIAVGSAGIATYAWDVIKRADDKRDSICGETLVRLFVQSDSREDADNVLEVMRKLIQNAHDKHWPNPQLLLQRLPAWQLTSAAVDSLVEKGLAADQLREIQWFASTALIQSGARRVVSELIQRIQRNQVNRAEAIRVIAHLGGPQAARFIIAAPNTSRDRALVLPWLVPTLDADAMDAFLRDEENRFLVSRALGLAKTKADWIEGVLGSTNWLNRGYAGLGLAYARGSEAIPAIAAALDAVHGEGIEAVRERILLNAALVVAGAHEHGQEILKWLPSHPQFWDDLAKQDVMAALSIALGRDHVAVQAWRRVGCAPAKLDPEVSRQAAL